MPKLRRMFLGAGWVTTVLCVWFLLVAIANLFRIFMPKSHRVGLSLALTRRQAVLIDYLRDHSWVKEDTAQDSPPRARLWKDLPRLWELFSLILPAQVHREAFYPAYQNMLEKYVLARKFRGKWARRWIAFCFTVLSLLMVLDCLRVMLQSGVGKILLKLLPDDLRSWWRRQ